jgi:hypothetical protein
MAAKTRRILDVSIEILRERQPCGIRHVCYQLFNEHRLLPSMDKRETNRVSEILTRARERGEIPWGWIVDNRRRFLRAPQWGDAEDFLDSVLPQFRTDWWQDQPERVVVISEKEGAVGVLRPVLLRYGVAFSLFSGYGSATSIKDLADLSAADRRPLTVLYVGDHDPSGRHMSDVDLAGRANSEPYGGVVTVERVAVTAVQIADLGLPTFPASDKAKDARYEWFLRAHGDACCELDTMNPNLLRDEVAEAISAHIDPVAWGRARRAEAAQQASIRELFASWPGVAR